MEKKKCKKCGELKPISIDYFNQLPSGGFRGTCKNCMALNTKSHYYADPSKVMDRVKKYKDQIKIAGGSYAPEDIMKIRQKLGDKCRYCGAPLSGGGEVDHIVPVSRGGVNSADNLTLACRSCNRDKHSKTAEEFISWRIQRGRNVRT